jgi:hypothetical protein
MKILFLAYLCILSNKPTFPKKICNTDAANCLVSRSSENGNQESVLMSKAHLQPGAPTQAELSPHQKIPARFEDRALGAWQAHFDPAMMPLAWDGARAQQVALSHELDKDFGSPLYAWDGWLVFIDAAGPVCLTAGFFSANVDTCNRAGGFERFFLEVDGVRVFEDSVDSIFFRGVPELPRPLTRATVDGSWYRRT